jgi:integrase
MKAAGIRQNSGDRQGFHIFRHKFVTTLLGNGIPRPVISNLTGHLLPESLEPYLSANFPDLKECAIGIEKFPVLQEVFDR